MTMAATIPHSRPLSDSEVEGPALKKQRLDVEEMEVEVKKAVESRAKEPEEIVISLESAQRNRAPKHKKKKRKEPPLPEPCSPSDVLYQEIRTLLGGDVVVSVTEAGGAFQPPYEYGEEVEVKIETIGSGGELHACFCLF